MANILDKIPENDPLRNPEQKAQIERIINDNKHLPGATMVVLNELQSQIGFVSPAMQQFVADHLRVPVSKVHGVISFYSFFTTQPRGKHTVKFCLGTACYVGGIDQIVEKAKQILGTEPGKTTEDGQITLEFCRCVGACSQAPVIVVDDDVFGRVRPNKLPQMLRPLLQKEE